MKNVKRFVTLTIIFMLTISQLAAVNVQAVFKPPFEIASKSAYMVNTDTDTVMYEKNAHEKIYPASLTKIMTAIIALETIKDLEGTIVTAPGYIFDELYGTGASHADIWRGENVRMIDLLYALMIPSACEAASIIADYIGDGSISDFVDMMNEKALEIGANDTVFANAHGLFNEEQHSTAYDMYLITKYAMEIPLFSKISNNSNYLMPATNKHEKAYNIDNTNAMLSKNRGGDKYYFPDMIGIKTGSLPEVGKNLITAVSRGGYNYLLVTMAAPTIDAEGKALPKGINKSYDDAILLYNWALGNFEEKKVLKQNETIDQIDVSLASQQDYVTLVAQKDVSTLMPADVEKTAVQRSITAPKKVVAPIKAGDVLGRLDLKLSGEIIASVDLVAMETIKRNEVLYYLDIVLKFLSKPLIIVLLVILILLFFLFYIVTLRYKRIKQRRDSRARKIMKS